MYCHIFSAICVLQILHIWLSWNLTVCVLCHNNGEDRDHLFVYCDYALCIWWRLLAEFNLEWVIPNCCGNLLLGNFGNFKGKRKTLRNCADLATYRAIWGKRNTRIFEIVSSSRWEVWEKIKLRVGQWLNESLSFSDLLRDRENFL